MPAQSKSALLEVTQKEFDKLQALLAKVSEEAALAKDADNTSIKDVVAHRAHWIDLFFGWYTDGQAGKEVHFPAPGYKWNELPRYNAALREQQKDLSWLEACALLSDGHERLSAFLDGLSEKALYNGPMKGAKNDWTVGRWAEATGPSHYRSAAKYIRARLKALG